MTGARSSYTESVVQLLHERAAATPRRMLVERLGVTTAEQYDALDRDLRRLARDGVIVYARDAVSGTGRGWVLVDTESERYEGAR